MNQPPTPDEAALEPLRIVLNNLTHEAQRAAAQAIADARKADLERISSLEAELAALQTEKAQLDLSYRTLAQALDSMTPEVLEEVRNRQEAARGSIPETQATPSAPGALARGSV